MIRGIIIILTVAWLSSFMVDAQTASVTLTWTPSSTPTIAGYEIFYGASGTNYTSSINVSNVSEVTIQGLTNGTTYYFAAQTYDSIGNLSALTPQISYVAGTTSAIPAAITSPYTSKIGRFGFSVNGSAGFQYAIEASTNLINWVVIGVNAAPFNFVDVSSGQFSYRFYRAVYSDYVVNTVTPVAGLLTSTFANPGQFGFTLTGTLDYPYALEASENLVNWIILGTNTAPSIFIDTNADQFSYRFYRAVPAPDAAVSITTP